MNPNKSTKPSIKYFYIEGLLELVNVYLWLLEINTFFEKYKQNQNDKFPLDYTYIGKVTRYSSSSPCPGTFELLVDTLKHMFTNLKVTFRQIFAFLSNLYPLVNVRHFCLWVKKVRAQLYFYLAHLTHVTIS